MKRLILLVIYLFVIIWQTNAQAEYKYIRQGNKKYKEQKYPQAETDYTKALKIKPNSIIGVYNLSNTYIKQQNYDNAIDMLIKISSHTNNKDTLSQIYYNLAEAYLQKAYSLQINKASDSLKQQMLKQKGQYLQHSLNYFKKSLVYNPKDEEAQFNYLLVKKLLKENEKQQQQQSQQQNQKQNNQQQKQQKQNQQQKQQQKQNQNQQQQNQNQQNNKQFNRLLNQIENMDQQAQKKAYKNMQQTTIQPHKNW